MPFFTASSGVNIRYQTHGSPERPALLLLTGLGGALEGWYRQVPSFQDDYHVITMDNRGSGKSASLDVPTKMLDFAQDSLDLLDHLSVIKAHVWGVSMGGKIAQEMAITWPDRISRLVLGCTSAGEAHRVDSDRESRLPRGKELSENEWLERVVPVLFGAKYVEANYKSMRAFARYRSRNPQDPIGLAHQWEAYEGFDSWNRLPLIKHETLVITGDDDRMTHMDNSKRLVERLSNARLAVVEGAGHSFHIESYEEVNRVVGTFLRHGLSA